MTRRKAAVLLAVTVVCGVVVASSTAAFADTPLQRQAVVVDASNLLNSPHRLPAATAKERADVDAFLRDQVQQGRVVDSSQLWVASGSNPLGGGDVSAVWE